MHKHYFPDNRKKEYILNNAKVTEKIGEQKKGKKLPLICLYFGFELVCIDNMHKYIFSASDWVRENDTGKYGNHNQYKKRRLRKEKGWVESRRRDERQEEKRRRWSIYREVISLRAWSSSSLIALYFSFCAYSSSGGQSSAGSRVQEEQQPKKEVGIWEVLRNGRRKNRRQVSNLRIQWRCHFFFFKPSSQ